MIIDCSSLKVSKFSWKELYRAAAIETDKARLHELIEAAKGTLLLRLLDLTDGLEDKEELRAVEDALQGLWRIKKERLIGAHVIRNRRASD
jgi:hypothetical protein